MLDDGKLIFKAENSNKKNEVQAVVIQGGELKSKRSESSKHKISLPCLTSKDLADLEFALDTGIEWIGLSFVRSVNDINELQKIISKRNHLLKLAKIEKPEAIQQIDAIIKKSDAIMVAVEIWCRGSNGTCSKPSKNDHP